MAIFHATLKTFGRSNGHSATAAAAYRIGAKIHDERTGVAHDYTKRDGVVSVHTITPTGVPAWASDPATLWNAAEAAETRINARVARELEIALPAELSTAQRQALTIAVSQLLADRYRVAVMAAIHEPSAAGDQRNHHAHILFTTRRIGPDGFGEKVRELDDRKTGPLEVESLRAAVAALTNEHLERAGCAERVDHRRLNVQSREAEHRGDFAAAFDLSREPTRHEAKDVTALRRRGADPYGAEWNEAVRASNAEAWRSFVEQAANDGRLAETPARSNREQAAADRAREAGAPALGVNAAASISPTPPRSVRRTPPAAPPMESGRNRIRLARGEGQQAIVVNSQAAAAEQTLKVEADVARTYRQDLEAALRQTALAADHPIRAYAELRQLTPVDVGILAGHCHADRRCARILRDGIDAHRVWERATTRPVRRRKAHGETMVQSTRAQRDFENVDATPQPPMWKPRNRRQWAELRRRQRAHLADAQQAEKLAARAASETAMRRYAADELAARSTARAFEARRRQQYPLPSDRLTVPRPRPVAVPKKETAPMPEPERTVIAEMPRRPRP